MKRPLLVIGILLLAGAAYGIYCAHRVVTVVVPNAYAADWSAAMVIEYLETHENKWPNSWEDLREPYETLAAPQNYPWSFDELQRRIVIDWDVDVESLQNAASTQTQPMLRMIWLSDGSETHWQGAEPNQRIIDYFQSIGPPAADVDPM